MGKKKKRKSTSSTAGSSKKKQAPKKKSKAPILFLAIGAALLITGAVYLFQGEETKSTTLEPLKTAKGKVHLREKRPTLPPERFQGSVRRAYAIAREIPEVLDGLYCYCRCRENFGHKNLLSCYVDTHAST